MAVHHFTNYLGYTRIPTGGRPPKRGVTYIMEYFAMYYRAYTSNYIIDPKVVTMRIKFFYLRGVFQRIKNETIPQMHLKKIVSIGLLRKLL